MLGTTAQIAEVLETPMDMEPIVFYSDRPSPELVMEMHDPESHALEVNEPGPESGQVEIVVQELPGVDEDKRDPDFEASLMVHDDVTVESNQTHEAKDKEDDKPASAWDWAKILASGGPAAFMAWVKERNDNVPKHSGKDKAGLLRAVGYLEKLANEVSKAMRQDLDGSLDADQIEHLLAEIENGVERLHDRIDLISKKKPRKKKAEFESTGLVKEAQKIPTVSGIVITVPLLISRIARVCINGTISAGHDMLDMYEEQCEKYKLNERERAEVQQLISDFGYPMIFNRGLMPGKDDLVKEHGQFDFSSNYMS